ncbi:hypothetical protein [Leisingera sp. M658]|uniref:hypothetical protein n=1 Tax=Leisingera sp. M658 TaxID=2867015 RepID=UPI0021A84E5C|nr:hypothetical protein [Leisingera sp. M658]UWQ76802.1 hypothetical protein K3724_10385 [Leisingera sp. M658]
MTQVTARDAAETEILEFIQTRLRFTRKELNEHCSASNWKQENFLRELTRRGVVSKCESVGKKRYYTAFGADQTAETVAEATMQSPVSTLGTSHHEHSSGEADRQLERLLKKMQDTPKTEMEFLPVKPETPEEQHIWDYISGRPYFSRSDVEMACASEIIRRRFLRRLQDAGIMRAWGSSQGRTLFTVKTAEEAREIAKDKRGSLEGIIWTAIRHQKRFKPLDLFAALAPARPEITLQLIVGYCRMLRLSGYIRVSARTRNLNADTPLFLIKNTGPLPPQKKRMTVIVDANDDRIIYAPGGRL